MSYAKVLALQRHRVWFTNATPASIGKATDHAKGRDLMRHLDPTHDPEGVGTMAATTSARPSQEQSRSTCEVTSRSGEDHYWLQNGQDQSGSTSNGCWSLLVSCTFECSLLCHPIRVERNCVEFRQSGPLRLRLAG